MEKSNIVKLVAALVFTLGFGSLGAVFTAPEINSWYVTLIKPSFNPPNWIFGPVWTTLYLLMGISFYLVWKQPTSPARTAGVLFFLIQFVLNFFWSFIFFRQHAIGIAFIEIVFMWLFIVFTINEFRKLHQWAAWLLLPYLLWVSFASVLNYSIWKLNS
jgi:tryptophan-rich sensory protein